MKKLSLIFVVLFSILLFAVTNPEVFYTKSGKTFHRTVNCMSLSQSKTIYAKDSISVSENRTPCKICYRQKVTPEIIRENEE